MSLADIFQGLTTTLGGGFEGYYQGRQLEQDEEERRERRKQRDEELAIRNADLARRGILKSDAVDPTETYVEGGGTWGRTSQRYKPIGGGRVQDQTKTEDYERSVKKSDDKREFSRKILENFDTLESIRPEDDAGGRMNMARSGASRPGIMQAEIKRSEHANEASSFYKALSPFVVGKKFNGVPMTDEGLRALIESSLAPGGSRSALTGLLRQAEPPKPREPREPSESSQRQAARDFMEGQLAIHGGDHWKAIGAIMKDGRLSKKAEGMGLEVGDWAAAAERYKAGGALTEGRDLLNEQRLKSLGRGDGGVSPMERESNRWLDANPQGADESDEKYYKRALKASVLDAEIKKRFEKRKP